MYSTLPLKYPKILVVEIIPFNHTGTWTAPNVSNIYWEYWNDFRILILSCPSKTFLNNVVLSKDKRNVGTMPHIGSFSITAPQFTAAEETEERLALSSEEREKVAKDLFGGDPNSTWYLPRLLHFNCRRPIPGSTPRQRGGSMYLNKSQLHPHTSTPIPHYWVQSHLSTQHPHLPTSRQSLRR